MKVFAETATTPQQVQTRFAYLRNVHETARWEIADAAEFVAELNEEETVTPASTNASVPATVSLKDWAHRCAIMPQHARAFDVMILARTDHVFSDEPWADRFLRENISDSNPLLRRAGFRILGTRLTSCVNRFQLWLSDQVVL